MKIRRMWPQLLAIDAPDKSPGLVGFRIQDELGLKQ